MTPPAITPMWYLGDEDQERLVSVLVLEGMALTADTKLVHMLASAATILNVPCVEFKTV